MSSDVHSELRVRSSEPVIPSPIGAPLIIAAAVFAACLFGIYTRPVGFLATVWPANAILLGLMVRLPKASAPLGWVAAGIAYLAADLLTGSGLVKALVLNGANLAGVAAAFLALRRFRTDVDRLRQPAGMLFLLVASAAGGAAAGLVGGVANPLLFGRSVMNGLTFWFATEFVNYVAILPVMLAYPAGFTVRRWSPASVPNRWIEVAPAAALILSCVAAVVIEGPGSIAFPVPALLWCGFLYPVFPTTVLTLLFGVWTLVVVSAGYIPMPAQAFNETALVSLRLGISMIAAAPIMLASVMQNRNDLLKRLHHLANHDPLTGARNRRAFVEEAEQRLERRGTGSAVMMVDLDHFKAVNDIHGHATGDRVLVTFALRARSCLRPDDLFGRLGGEEFAVMLPDCSEVEAVAVAERIRAATRLPVTLDGGRTLAVTVSIGIVAAAPGAAASLDDLLSRADLLLYRAKTNGRDRIETTSIAAPAEPAAGGVPTPAAAAT